MRHPHRITLALAGERDLARIYELRYEVYSSELGQHPANDHARMTTILHAALNLYMN